MLELATLAGGCFWCTEAIFQKLNGVLKVTSGYTGGHIPNPTYEQVCTGTTGHAEALQIEFDSEKISYETLLEIFFATHDSTTLNQQGGDVGTQYRSAIFYHSAVQKQLAQNYKSTIPNSVTEIVEFNQFYPAENYHQNYYLNHTSAPYCALIISPKLAKLTKLLSHPKNEV